eukprot:INCI8926.1.p1 GENE.INCI8926.1~~INCI8926.1.p1  ORF type:complete len:198 (-),score=36.65 INCI8926.1:607-1200(-)
MDSLFGFIGKDYAMLAADANAARSILVFKQDEDKIIPLSKKMAMATSGAQGDRVQFSEYVHKNIVLNELRAGFPMSCVATANFVRNEISANLRRKPFNVNCLLGGFEAGKGSCMYYIDYFGTMHKMNFGCHGHCAAFCLSLFDRHWEPGMSLEDGKELMRKCFTELKVRYLLNMPKFVVKVVDANGVHEINLSDESE